MSHTMNPKPITDSKEFVKRMNDLRSKTVSAQALAEAQPVSYTHLTLPTTPYV